MNFDQQERELRAEWLRDQQAQREYLDFLDWLDDITRSSNEPQQSDRRNS